MNKKIKINKRNLDLLKKDCFEVASIIFKKKLDEFNNDFYKKLKNKNLRSKIFDCFNMCLSLQLINYEISKTIEKLIKKKIINWTYPQIRVDGTFANDFSAPPHKDGWILNKDKKGYVVWFPINKNGASLLLSNKNTTKNIIKDKYWGMKAIDDLNYEEVYLKYGEALIFDKNLLHKSKINQNRITVQCRFEEFNNKFKKRSVNQVIDPEVKKYWENKQL